MVLKVGQIISSKRQAFSGGCELSDLRVQAGEACGKVTCSREITSAVTSIKLLVLGELFWSHAGFFFENSEED